MLSRKSKVKPEEECKQVEEAEKQNIKQKYIQLLEELEAKKSRKAAG